MTVTAKLLDSLGNPITAANALPVQIPAGITLTGEVEVKNDSGNPVPVNGTVQANNLVGGVAVSNTNPMPISDAGGSLTVDGTIAATQSGAWNVTNITGTVSLPTGAATETSLAGVRADLGTDGPVPPSIPGTGVRGWLRSIYDTLRATLTVTGTVQANNLVGGTAVSNANPLPISDAGGSLTVDGSVTATLAAGTQSIGNIGTVATITNPVSVTDNGGSLTVDGTITANQGTAGASPWPVSDGGGSLTVDGTVSVGNFPANQPVNLASGPGTSVASPAFMARVPDDLCVNATGAAAAAVTLTIPGVVGQFHYIDSIEITLYSTAARTGAAAPITVTTTNLPGNPTWPFETAGAIGTAIRYSLSANAHIKSASAGANTTIVCPAVTGGLWNVKVFYRTAP